MLTSPYLACIILYLPLFGFLFNAFSGYLFRSRDAQKRAVSIVAPLVVLAGCALSFVVLFWQVLPTPGHRLIVPLIPGASSTAPWIRFAGFSVDFNLVLDPLSILMALIVTGIGGLIHVYATGYMADDLEQPRFFTYFNLFIFMMLLLVMADNFLLLFVGWEGVGTCSYLLISFWFTDVNNAKAGNKAFIVNRIGDVGFALGIMAVFGVFGTLTFFTATGHGVMDLAAHAGGAIDAMGNPVAAASLTMICCLLFVGAVGKSAQIPLFVWLPDAMAGPTPVSALIHAATMVTAGVVMLTRCSWLFVQSAFAMQVVGWVGLATALVGATIALVQTDIKRVLAFSTVSQLGYMVLACGVGNFTAAMFHVLTHACFKALLFLGAGAVIHSMLGEQDMRRMGGLKRLLPATWAVMFIATYAIAGFPLLSGFWSKDAILDSAARCPWGDGPILYGVGLFTAFLTAFYMNRLMWKTFYTEPRFVNGQLAEHHHGITQADLAGDHDALAAGEAEHNPNGEQTGHEEAAGGAEAHGTGSGSVHPSPNSMMIPLYILAFLSAVVGIAMFWQRSFQAFLAPSVASLPPGEEPSFLHGSVGSIGLGYIYSSLVAIAGLAAAFALYRQHMKSGELAPQPALDRNPLYRFLRAKWGFDAVYNFLFIQLGGQFASRILWKTIDQEMIDGAVNGLAGAVGRISAGGRRMQTGFVRNYALVMMVGAVCVLMALLIGVMRQ